VCKKGFTLIELIVVVAIIGLLAAMIVPRFVGRTEEAKRAAAKADIEGALGVALDAFEVDVGRYPTTEEGLRALQVNPTSPPLPNWKGPYIKKKGALKDPWGTPYQYVCPGIHNPDSYDLFSYGRDKRRGGEGYDADITNWEE
jgi:general secretion pathway protein G